MINRKTLYYSTNVGTNVTGTDYTSENESGFGGVGESDAGGRRSDSSAALTASATGGPPFPPLRL